MGGSKIKDENYFQVTGWMLNQLHLKGMALQVYAIIYGFSQDGESSFTGSLQYLSDFTNASKPTVIKALKELVEKGYILKYETETNGVKFNRYKANLLVVKNLYRGSKESLLGGSKESLHNNKDIDNKLNNNITIIVEYLNQKTGKAFKTTSQATRSAITARLNDGFTVDNFKTVIDTMCSKWKGGKMEEYLRPSTLFGTKFENYLNAKGRTSKDGQNTGDSSKPRYGNCI